VSEVEPVVGNKGSVIGNGVGKRVLPKPRPGPRARRRRWSCQQLPKSPIPVWSARASAQPIVATNLPSIPVTGPVVTHSSVSQRDLPASVFVVSSAVGPYGVCSTARPSGAGGSGNVADQAGGEVERRPKRAEMSHRIAWRFPRA